MGATDTRNIVITGAAAGIGRAVAERFVQAGWFVGAYDVDEAGLQSFSQQWGQQRCRTGRLDVTDQQDWAQQLADFVQAAGGHLDVLVNNAGVSATDHFEKIPLARHHRLIDINLKGVVNGCHMALPYLTRTPGARVINLCSASALYGQPMLSTYSATKAAVRSFTEALDIEWQRHGIRVVDVLPLFVNTAMVANDVSKMKTVQTLGVRLTPADIAESIWRLANRAASRLPVHTPVGLQTKLFYLLCKLSPDAVNRFVTARMAGH
ncbi:MAG: SDR family oxidoreductase [Burkholderiales bacterium]|nr:MAG: SDR family oxidoreductase [Burkholderiales bacterium]